MKGCRKIKKLLATYISDELTKNLRIETETHLKTCLSCNNEYQLLKTISNQTDYLNEESEKIIQSINWEDAKTSITNKTKQKTFLTHKTSFLQQINWKILYPIAITIFIFGIMVGYILFYSKSHKIYYKKPSLKTNFSLKQIESFLNKKEVIDYLKQSQLIFTDLMKQPDNKIVTNTATTLNLKKVQNLLRQNRYFRQNLQDPDLLSARNLLKKIEWLLFEIVSTGQNFSSNKLRQLQIFIEKERLLLKIRLIEEELTNNKKHTLKINCEV